MRGGPSPSGRAPGSRQPPPPLAGTAPPLLRTGRPWRPAQLSSVWSFVLQILAASVFLHVQLYLLHTGSSRAAHQLRSPRLSRQDGRPGGTPPISSEDQCLSRPDVWFLSDSCVYFSAFCFLLLLFFFRRRQAGKPVPCNIFTRSRVRPTSCLHFLFPGLC